MLWAVSCAAARATAGYRHHTRAPPHARRTCPHAPPLTPPAAPVWPGVSAAPQFGVCQDCYMPKDPSKQGHRGIGFVTYASPESGAPPAAAALSAAPPAASPFRLCRLLPAALRCRAAAAGGPAALHLGRQWRCPQGRPTRRSPWACPLRCACHLPCSRAGDEPDARAEWQRDCHRPRDAQGEGGAAAGAAQVRGCGMPRGGALWRRCCAWQNRLWWRCCCGGVGCDPWLTCVRAPARALPCSMSQPNLHPGGGSSHGGSHFGGLMRGPGAVAAPPK